MRALRLLALVSFAFSLALMMAAPAVAQETSKNIPVQLFEPALGLDNLLGVESGQVADHLRFGVGTLLNYQSKPMVLYTKSYTGTAATGFDIANANELVAVKDQLTADIIGVIGLQLKWLHMQAALDLPVNALMRGQNFDNVGQPLDEFSNSGIGDLRLQLKAQLLRDVMGFSLAFSPIFTFPTGKRGAFAGEETVSVRPRVAADWRLGPVMIAANVGWLFRKDALLFSTESGDQLLFGLGVGYQIHPRLQLIGEVNGRAGLSTKSGCKTDSSTGQAVCSGTSSTDLDAYPLEADAGLRINLYHGLDLTLGGGAGVVKAVGSPQYRVLAGLTWAPDFRDSDHDGVADWKDQCPTKPEDRDGFKDDDGCPDLDNDGDGVPDTLDKCPNTPEDFDEFQDQDGCPDVDNDGDGIPDIKDECPMVPETKNGFKDDDGCPDIIDADEDGIADAKDKCPKEPEDLDKFQDEDGCPDPDNDNDDVPDQFDQCPNEAEDYDQFQDDDGCPDPDNDKDGLLDKQDKCPNEPETINGFKDEDGCPDKGESHVIIQENKIVITKVVYFATNKAIIKPISFSILSEVALVMRANPQIKKVQVEGHTDNQGDAKRNKVLSQQRAEAVRDYLIKKGQVDAARLTAVGFGAEKPIEDNKTARGRASNRRVEFLILEVAAEKKPVAPAKEGEDTNADQAEQPK